jgi:pimeloyl-ACP methyl ester carboxylesterase
MASFYFDYNSSRIHYRKWGTGKKILLCFHGYGESASSFAFLEPALGQDFTILAIDLPFHGHTEWNEGFFLSPPQFLTLVDEMITRSAGVGKEWSVLGYSMGGRIALHILEVCPEKFERLLLLAPDGLKLNPWYWLATQTGPGNVLFRWTMRHPAWFLFLVRLYGTVKLVNPGIYKFIVHYINDGQVRRELYARWTTMRGFRPHPAAIARIIRVRKLPVSLFYGSFDRLMRRETGERFRKRGIAAYCRLILLPTGHQLLRAQFLDAFQAELKGEPAG